MFFRGMRGMLLWIFESLALISVFLYLNVVKRRKWTFYTTMFSCSKYLFLRENRWVRRTFAVGPKKLVYDNFKLVCACINLPLHMSTSPCEQSYTSLNKKTHCYRRMTKRPFESKTIFTPSKNSIAPNSSNSVSSAEFHCESLNLVITQFSWTSRSLNKVKLSVLVYFHCSFEVILGQINVKTSV